MPRSARRRRSAAARLPLFLAAVLATTACGLDLTGASDDGPDAGARVDAGGSSPGADATVGTTTDADPSAADAGPTAPTADTGPSPAPDAGPTDPGADAGTDAGCATGLSCGGQCSPTASCNACAAGNVECRTSTPRTCTASCAADCPGSPGGLCQPLASAYCFSTFYTHCRCTVGDPSTCPIESHVCVPVLGGGECRTCGEAQTDKRDCKNGKTCDAKPGGPGPGGGQLPVCAD
jgi:hypothetical protein